MPPWSLEFVSRGRSHPSTPLWGLPCQQSIKEQADLNPQSSVAKIDAHAPIKSQHLQLLPRVAGTCQEQRTARHSYQGMRSGARKHHAESLLAHHLYVQVRNAHQTAGASYRPGCVQLVHWTHQNCSSTSSTLIACSTLQNCISASSTLTACSTVLRRSTCSTCSTGSTCSQKAN